MYNDFSLVEIRSLLHVFCLFETAHTAGVYLLMLLHLHYSGLVRVLLNHPVTLLCLLKVNGLLYKYICMAKSKAPILEFYSVQVTCPATPCCH